MSFLCFRRNIYQASVHPCYKPREVPDSTPILIKAGLLSIGNNQTLFSRVLRSQPISSSGSVRKEQHRGSEAPPTVTAAAASSHEMLITTKTLCPTSLHVQVWREGNFAPFFLNTEREKVLDSNDYDKTGQASEIRTVLRLERKLPVSV